MTTSQNECVADIVEGEEEKRLIVVGNGEGGEVIGVNRTACIRGEEK